MPSCTVLCGSPAHGLSGQYCRRPGRPRVPCCGPAQGGKSRLQPSVEPLSSATAARGDDLSCLSLSGKSSPCCPQHSWQHFGSCATAQAPGSCIVGRGPPVSRTRCRESVAGAALRGPPGWCKRRASSCDRSTHSCRVTWVAPKPPWRTMVRAQECWRAFSPGPGILQGETTTKASSPVPDDFFSPDPSTLLASQRTPAAPKSFDNEAPRPRAQEPQSMTRTPPACG